MALVTENDGVCQVRMTGLAGLADLASLAGLAVLVGPACLVYLA